MHRRRAPPSAQHACDADRGDHHDRDVGAQQRPEAGKESERVASIDRSVVISQQQLDEPEHQRAREGDLEGDQDVLTAGTEQHEQRGGRGRNPRINSRPPHQRAEQRRRDQMQTDRAQLVGQIGVQAEHPVQDAEHQRRERHEVIAVG